MTTAKWLLVMLAWLAGGSHSALAQQPEAPAPDSKASWSAGTSGAAAGAKPAKPGKSAETKKPAAKDSKKPSSPTVAPTASGTPSAKPAEALPVPAQTAVQPVAIPPPEVLLMLVRTTIAALNQANFTANYTVLHGLGTPGLQAKNSPEALGNAFADMRQQGFDLSPALVLTPQLTDGPEMLAGGALKFGGFFPSAPHRIKFAMIFMPVDGRWRIDALSVELARAAEGAATGSLPAAVSTPPPAAAAK